MIEHESGFRFGFLDYVRYKGASKRSAIGVVSVCATAEFAEVGGEKMRHEVYFVEWPSGKTTTVYGDNLEPATL